MTLGRVQRRTMPLRVPAEWMVSADDRILEYLDENGARRPSLITGDDRVQFGRQHASNRLIKLADAGLVVNLGDGLYQITDDGRRYLAGELDARDLDG